MKTIFFPFHLSNNTYCDLVISALENSGIKVKKLSYALKHPKYFISTDIINLNFYENIPNNCSRMKAFGLFVGKMIFLDFCRLCRIKVIYTMHNKQQHDAVYKNYNSLLMKRLVLRADAIVSLCSEGRDIIEERFGKKYTEKTVVISHPNYLSQVMDCTEHDLLSFRKKIDANNCMLFTFIGAISPYKNIEHIIDAANELKDYKVKFFIAGNANNKSYVEELKKRSYYNNIVWDIRFIPDSEIGVYIKASDVLLLPYNKQSSLNSGSVFLIFSLGKTCVVPRIGSIKDLKNQNDIFSYDYESDEEHYEKFYAELKKAIDVYNSNKESIGERGIHLLKEIRECNSLDVIGRKYLDLYTNLVHSK